MLSSPAKFDDLSPLVPDLLRLAHRLTGEQDAAQDLCQDVLLKLWSRMRQGHSIDNLRGYAGAAMRNAFRQQLRERQVTVELHDDTESTTPEVFAKLALRDLRIAIGSLPPKQARLMRLVAEGETSPLALSYITGWPLGTVMSRLARARAGLRSELGLRRDAPVAELI